VDPSDSVAACAAFGIGGRHPATSRRVPGMNDVEDERSDHQP
jgi:hypothetical protein